MDEARGVDSQTLGALIAEQTEGRALAFIGEPRVNVLALNITMDERFPFGK